MNITLNGKQYKITRESVERVGQYDPEPVLRYALLIGGKRYPIKQAASVGVGVPPVAFTSQQAYRWLSALDFNIIDTQR